MPPFRCVDSKQIYPLYYSNTVLRLLPALDYVICKFIECGDIQAIENILQNYGRLYLFHSYPIKFVRDTLFYYYQGLGFESKKLLLQLIGFLFSYLTLGPEMNEMSPLFLEYLQNGNIDLCGEEYLISIFENLKYLSSKAERIKNNEYSQFKEFGGKNTLSYRYALASIEIMVIGNFPITQ